MKTFIIDWGKNASGGRYALIQAYDISEAFWDADSIGSPFKIAQLKIPKSEDGIRYLELHKKPYAGVSPDCLQWRESRDVLGEEFQAMKKGN